MEELKWDREFAMEQAADDASLLEELVVIFRNSCKEDYQLLQEGLARNDTAKSSAAAHSIKGAAASLGFEGIRELAQEIEDDCRQGSMAVVKKKNSTLQELILLLEKV